MTAAQAAAPAKRTPLHHLHTELGARMMPFAGYELPVQVDVFDPAGERVFCAEIRLWISAKPPAAAPRTSS